MEKVISKFLNITLALIFVIGVGAVLTNKTAYAQWDKFLKVISDSSPEKAEEFDSIDDLTGVAVNIILGSGLTVSFIFIIKSGIGIMSARGDVKGTMSAKQGLTYSIIAFLIIAGAFSIKDIILDVLGVNSADQTRIGP